VRNLAAVGGAEAKRNRINTPIDTRQSWLSNIRYRYRPPRVRPQRLFTAAATGPPRVQTDGEACRRQVHAVGLIALGMVSRPPSEQRQYTRTLRARQRRFGGVARRPRCGFDLVQAARGYESAAVIAPSLASKGGTQCRHRVLPA